MTDPRYDPKFQHTDWVDNVDRISAGGANGFNVRFDTITSDLRQLSTVVLQVDAALDLAAGGAVGPQVLTVPLDFPPTPQRDGWTYDANGAGHPQAGAAGGTAVMGLTLPDHIRLTSFRAIGQFGGGTTRLILTLGRAQLTVAAPVPDKLAEIRSDTQTLPASYDVTAAVDSRFGLVDLSLFRYFLLANATQVSSPQLTSLSAVQLGFSAA
ncbi:hypothetical protein [Amycolatopsis sp. RTGN1]|uniref:hypothetical protein n=1 Tax=Amycolatopsis ponsaeliensis TaxID=2992142 RepID=UPI00254FC9BE|nr:hypothetical protein [Amycolatopsis sp. RTGN1]